MIKKFTIIITTKNRLIELKFTLQKIANLLSNKEVACVICDDGSSDGTFDFIRSTYPSIRIFRNEVSKGLIYSRNRLMDEVTGDYAISIDDDLHFLIDNPLDIIENHFQDNPKCGLLTFRIYWNKKLPVSLVTEQKLERVKSYAGGAHVYRMQAWKNIPNYPDWFVFYGEEDFAAYQLFKKGWEIHYLPEVLVHHRVDIKARKNEKDYQLRLRRSLRSGWYLYMMFYPWREIPRRFAYTLWIQIKNKMFKGDWKAAFAIIQAFGDLVINLPRLFYHSNRLTAAEFKAYSKLSETKLYWTPEEL